MLISVRNI